MFAVAPRPAPLPLSQAGPSTAQQPLKRKTSVGTGNVKRKRAITPDDLPQDSTGPQPQKKAREGPKKKKANRACFHCQKAHLTCDDSRPCLRCVKRGIASNCTEGHRKKAKYLLDDDELEQLKRHKSTEATKGKAPEASPTLMPTVPIAEPISPQDALLTTSFDPSFSFGSEAANLEYSILSAILGNPSPPDSASSPPPPPPHSHYSWPSESLDFATSPKLGAYAAAYGDTQPLSMASDVLSSSPSTNHYLNNYSYPKAQRQDGSQSPEVSYSSAPYAGQGALQHIQPRYPLDQRPRSPPASATADNCVAQDSIPRGLLTPPLSNASPISIAAVPPTVTEVSRPKNAISHLQSINDRVTKPYDYTEGYHFLMKHLPSRFEKNDILRIVRALAIFRPSLIALQMPLSMDDEIFVEKCFQRSLLELGKLISYSGTPTVVWRRTGEICLVAPEFCMLTEWPMEELVGRKKFIYELFENQSVVEYWENFASHAFENTTRSVYSHCVLLKPNGAPVPATFCFSIRRDLFDLPSMVIGQWLPLL